MNDVNFTLPFGESGEAFVAPGDGPTGGYDLAQCQDSGAVTCGAPVDVVKDWDTLTLTGDTTVWCRPDSGPGGWDFLPDCVRGLHDGCDPNALASWIARNDQSILQVTSVVLAGTAVVVVVVGTGGTAAVVLAAGAGATGILGEALDEAPCRSERVTITAVLTIWGGGVGGAFGAGGLATGEVLTSLGIVGANQLEISC